MKLSEHFTLEELVLSPTALRLEIDNTPSSSALSNLQSLAIEILEPLRLAWGKPIVVSSGYRCRKLNDAVGGAKNSQHLEGSAADIHTLSDLPEDNKALFALTVAMIREGKLRVGQLIDEYHFNWIHISLPSGKRHNQILHLTS